MGIKGLTLYHLKSHLQKYRLGKQSSKEFNENSKDDTFRGIFRKNSQATMSKIHVYGFSKAQDPELEFHERIRTALVEVAVDAEMHRVRLVAPGKWMLCASFVLPEVVAFAKEDKEMRISHVVAQMRILGITAPTSQSFANYVLLAIVYGSILIHRKTALQMKWYFYRLLGIVDVEANFLVVKAY